eukprot:COSAG02_NODE_179_length_31090_cov_49.813785_5_plen_173_part_00
MGLRDHLMGLRDGLTTNDLATFQVDLAPTWLELAGITKPSCMDGRSIVPLIIPKLVPGIPPVTAAAIHKRRPAGSPAAERSARELDEPATWRTESFFQYYGAGPWAPANGGDQCHLCTQAGRPMCAPTGNNASVHNPKCDPRARFLDDFSNTYIGESRATTTAPDTHTSRVR